MATYLYCPDCKAVNPASLDSLPSTKERVVKCSRCGKMIKQNELSLKVCPDCGEMLYVSYDNYDVDLPCRERHEQERLVKEKQQEEEQAKSEAENLQKILREKAETEKRAKQEENDNMARLMREIPCQSCPNEILRIGKDGKYTECPNCHNTPTEAWIAECWKKLSGQEPDLIQWRDDTGIKIVHVDQRASVIAPYSVLLVAPDHFVVFESDGRRKILYPEVYPIFKNPYTQEEKLKLLYEGQDPDALSLGLGQRIVFFSEHEHELSSEVVFKLNDNEWEVTLPFTITMQMRSHDAENIMRHAMDLTDDQTASDYLEQKVKDALRSEISRIIRQHSGEDALLEIQNDVGVKVWLDEIFSINELQKIRNNISENLEKRYGIHLAQEIEPDIDGCSAKPVGRMNKIICPVCSHHNYLRPAVYQNRERFSCENCGKTIVWCDECNEYVSTEYNPFFCDKAGHRIWN